MTDLHPQAPTGAQLYLGAAYMRSHFVPQGAILFPRRAKSIAGFVAKRPRVRNENQDSSRQVIPGVNVEADLSGIKIDYMPDVDSILPFRVSHNGAYHIGTQLGTTNGAGTVTTNGTTAIVGSSSAFTSALVGQYITITGEPKPVRVATFTDATHITLAAAATTSSSGLTWRYSSIPVFPYLLHPRTPNEASPAIYPDSMWYEASDGDGYPVVVYEVQQQDLEFKVSAGKIGDVSETWMGCYDAYASDASVTVSAATYTEKPFLFGHFTAANAALLPLRIKITNAAGSGYDGKFKAALTRTLTGTVATAGTTAIVGTSTLFTTELTVGDELYIAGESLPLIVSVITDATHLTLTTAATTTASALSTLAATFSGTAIAFTFGLGVQVTTPSQPFGLGRSPFDTITITFPDGYGTVSANDEWSFTEPRVLPNQRHSNRDVLHSAGVQVVIDGQAFGAGVPGLPGFDDISVKLTIPKEAYKCTGSVYSQAVYPNGRTMATISFGRKRSDRFFLNKLIAAQSISVTITIYGNPFGSTGIPETWQFTFRTCEISDDQRDVTSENVLDEKIEINATRGLTRDLAGTVTTNGTTTLTGVGSAFDTELFEGDEIYITGETVRTVASITSATSATLTAAASTSGSGKTASAVSPVWIEKLYSTHAGITAATF